jgi:hypothetical protein
MPPMKQPELREQLWLFVNYLPQWTATPFVVAA